MKRRLVAIAVIELLGIVQLIAWMWLATLAWIFRDHSVFSTYSPQVTAQHTALAVGLSAAFVVNVVAFAVFARAPDGSPPVLFLAVLMTDVVLYIALFAFGSWGPDPILAVLALAAALGAVLVAGVRYSKVLRR